MAIITRSAKFVTKSVSITQWSIEVSGIPPLFLAGAVTLLVGAPLAYVIISSFTISPIGEPVVYGLNNWVTAFDDSSVWSSVWNTITLAITRQAIAIIVGVLVVWLIVRTDMPLKGFLEFMFWLSFFLPALPVTLGWLLLLDGEYGLINQWLKMIPFVDGPVFEIYSFWGIVWVHLSATTIGVKVLLLGPAFRNLDATLEEASHASGASPLRTLFYIVVPLLAPAILVSLVLGTIRSLEAFEIELLLGVPIGLEVYSTKIHDFATVEPPKYGVASALGSAFLLILFSLVILQKWYTKQRMYHTVRGQGFTARPLPLGKWKYPACIFVSILAVTITVVPSLALVLATFMAQFGYFDIPHPWTSQHWVGVINDPQFRLSVRNTLAVGMGAAVLGVLFFGMIAYVIIRVRFLGRAVLDFMSWIPWAIPGILLSLALLWAVFSTRITVPLYGTVYLLVIAMVIKSMPVGVQLFRSVLIQIGSELEESSWVSGASRVQTYRRIVMPLLSPATMVVAILIFMSAVRDISTIVLLGTGRTQTLALLALEYSMEGEYGRATVVSMVTVIIVVLTAILARFVGLKFGLSRFSGG